MARESKEAKRKRLAKIIGLLARYYPDAHCALDHSNDLELLIATILSAQCTDERVNVVTRSLFKKYKSAADFVAVPVEQLEADIRPTGFFRNKAKSIKGACEAILNVHGGKVPATMEDLVHLPGVGRKTANVVLGNAFGIASGIVVDTHVGRLSRRLGLTGSEAPERVESELCDLVPSKHWILFSHWLIHHGRQVCKARKPLCATCFLSDLCPKNGVTAARR